jgi:hypothetical protein
LIQLADTGDRRIGGDAQERAPLVLQGADPRRVRLHGVPFALEPSAQKRWQRRPIPPPSRPQMGRKSTELRERNALAGEQAFHSIRMPPAVPSREQQLPVHLSSILLDGRRHVDDAPHLGLATVRPNQHRYQLRRI